MCSQEAFPNNTDPLGKDVASSKRRQHDETTPTIIHGVGNHYKKRLDLVNYL